MAAVTDPATDGRIRHHRAWRQPKLPGTVKSVDASSPKSAVANGWVGSLLSEGRTMWLRLPQYSPPVRPKHRLHEAYSLDRWADDGGTIPGCSCTQSKFSGNPSGERA